MESVYGCSDKFANCFWPEVVPSESHAVLYELPLAHNGQPPVPHRSITGWKWDQKHVRLPCSPESQYPVRKSDGSSEVVNRWELIETTLLGRTIKSSKDLESAIFSYNSKYASSWNFRGLHTFFEAELDEPESELFFSEILPKLIQLALQLPTLVPSAIPLLKSGQNMSVSLTQQQISCLMANAFLCTFPRRNTNKTNSEYRHFPDINFNRLFYSTQSSVMEKLKCICHYFRRVTKGVPIGVVTFRRRSLPAKYIPKFNESATELKKCRFVVQSSGTIEADGKGLLQVDFANKMIGGGVLGQGCVQEEIRFMICPELLITRLFTEVLHPDEALFIVGAEQFSLYSGYASSFEWAGNYNDPTPLDGNQRRQCQIVAIDALPFQDPAHQFMPRLMLRELTKAYVGFARLQQQQRVAPGVASGNWGCGAFMGDPHLKSLLQLMICAIAERPLVYFTFGDQRLVGELEDMYKFLCEKNVTVAQLWMILEQFGQKKNADRDELFEFIKTFLQRRGNHSTASTSKSSPLQFLANFVPKLTVPTTKEEQEQFERDFAVVRTSEKVASKMVTKVEVKGSSSAVKPRDYSDTDDEAQVEMERKKKMTSPAGTGGREKQPKMSLIDCLDSYFSKENSTAKKNNQPSTSRGDLTLDRAVSINRSEEEEEIDNGEVTIPTREEGAVAADIMEEEIVVSENRFDVVVQIDEDGGEYIDVSPPEKTVVPVAVQELSVRQTKLVDFFKLKSNKK